MDGGRPRHTTLLLGRLGLEPCCTREDVEMRWIEMVNEARDQGQQMDRITQECYELLKDERRWAGKPQGRKKNDVHEDVKVFLLENNLYSVMESAAVRQGLTGVTLEALSIMSGSALQDIGFSVKERLQVDLAFGRLESKDQAVALLLQEAGLSSFIDAFKWHQVDINTVGMLTQEDLDEIGLTDPAFIRNFQNVMRGHPARGEDDADEEEELRLEPDEHPVLRLVEGLTTEEELENAKAMIRDLHMERVEIVSRVGHDLVLEQMETQRLRDQILHLQHALASGNEILGARPPEGLDACVTSMLSASLALPGGNSTVSGRAEEAVAEACARTLHALAQEDTLKSWRDRVLEESPNDAGLGLMLKLRRAVAQILKDQVSKEKGQEQKIEELEDLFDEERAVTLKLLHVTKQHEAEVAELQETLDRERRMHADGMDAIESLLAEKDEAYRVLKMEIGVLGKTLEESRKRQSEERDVEITKLWEERDKEILKLRDKMEQLLQSEHEEHKTALADKDKQIEELAEMYLQLEAELDSVKKGRK